MKKRRNMKTKTTNDETVKRELSKDINKKMRREKRKRNTKRIMEAIEKGKSLKNIMNTGNLGKSHMIALNSKDGKTTNNRDQIVKITGEFYKNLYT